VLRWTREAHLIARAGICATIATLLVALVLALTPIAALAGGNGGGGGGNGGGGGPDTSTVGDLVGNLSGATYLLIPVVLGLALVTAFTLGSSGETGAEVRRQGGMSRALARQAIGQGIGSDKETTP